MDKIQVIDVDYYNVRTEVPLPVIDLESNQYDEEIILVGEKRKKSTQRNSMYYYIHFYMLNGHLLLIF